jgi:hypothetical protein
MTFPIARSVIDALRANQAETVEQLTKATGDGRQAEAFPA